MRRFAPLGLLGLLTACGASRLPPADLPPDPPPAWIGFEAGEYLAEGRRVLLAVGALEQPVKSHALACATAKNRARAAVGQHLDTLVKVATTCFGCEYEAGDSAEESASLTHEQALKTLRANWNQNIRILATWRGEAGVYALATTDLDAFVAQSPKLQDGLREAPTRPVPDYEPTQACGHE